MPGASATILKERDRQKEGSNLVFYAQSTSAVISWKAVGGGGEENKKKKKKKEKKKRKKERKKRK